MVVPVIRHPVRIPAPSLYPRSFLQLILFGNILVALPLLAAIAYASLRLDDLAQRSGSVMRQASQAATVGAALPEDVDRMERALRQYESLGDPTVLSDYAAARRAWRDDSAAYAAIPLVAPVAQDIEALRQTEAAAFARLGNRGGQAALRSAVMDLRQRLRPLLAQVGRLTETENQAFREQTEAVRRRMQVATAAAIVAAGLLLWWGRQQTERLWSRFERAVLALGEGRLDRTIQLKGPKDMQRIGRRLEWLRRRLKTLEEQRTLILRHVSHELKTPLAAIREGTSLLNEGAAGPLTPAQAELARIMHANVLRQQALIESLLKLQRAGFAGERMNLQRLRLDEIVAQAAATHELVARNRHLELAADLAPVEMAGGREELTAVVDNLLGNAIKFSPDGGRIEIRLTRDDGHAILDVVDAGPGIPPDERGHVFEPFYRGEAARGVAGAGLGLAISRQFARAHRGDLFLVDSATGAHFRVLLPLVPPGTSRV